MRNAVAKVLAGARSAVDAKRGVIHCQKISISVGMPNLVFFFFFLLVCSLSCSVPVTQVVYWHPDDHQASFYVVGNDRTVRFQGSVLSY